MKAPVSVEWLEVLRAQCALTSQRVVAERLGISPSVINQTLKGTYKGNLKGLEQRVRGSLLKEEVFCPGLGFAITKLVCQQWQQRKHPQMTESGGRVFKECRSGCVHSKLPNLYGKTP